MKKKPLKPERCGCLSEDNVCLLVESGISDYPHNNKRIFNYSYDKKLICSIKDYKKCEIYLKAFQQHKGALIEYLLAKKLHDEQKEREKQ